ncbi:hypothetical protein [Kerstersia similis]|uniref:hypothetical protein n=1 Tax=Kerstersia similis TaxID=206505 RepID=UPI0039EF8EF1
MKNDTFHLSSGSLSATVSIVGDILDSSVWHGSFIEIKTESGKEIALDDGFNNVVANGTKEDARRALHKILDDLAAKRDS